MSHSTDAMCRTIDESKLVFTMMMEELPAELWLEIFVYMKISERFDGFWNLNQRINRLLIKHFYSISLKNNDANSRYLMEYVLPKLPHPTKISTLRLENIREMNLLFQNSSLLHFSSLTSLTLSHLFITKDILDLLQFHAPNLRYLNASSRVSNKWNILLALILSLPKLQTCYLQLGIALCPMKTSIVSTSPIEHLILLGAHQTCSTLSLTSVLQYFPQLRSLRLHCDRFKCNKIDRNPLLFLSSFSLHINHLPDLFLDFLDLISNTMPYLHQLKIKCSTPLQDLVYLNVNQWIKLIDCLPNLEELILFVTSKKTWTKRIEQLRILMNIRHITFTHRIEHTA